MYDEEEVQKIFRSYSPEEISFDYRKEQLLEMHRAVYGNCGRGSLRKLDIARSIARYFAGIERARRMAP